MKKIYLLTKNKFKWLAAKSVFEKLDIDLVILRKNYPEIQADTSLEIAKYTALMAAKENKGIVIREDVSIYINALGGFPGPYANYFDRHIPPEKILDLMSGCEDRYGYFELAAVIAWPNGDYKKYVYKVPIQISKVCRGKRDGWDKIIMLKDGVKTFAECDEQENVEMWNKNYRNIVEDLSRK